MESISVVSIKSILEDIVDKVLDYEDSDIVEILEEFYSESDRHYYYEIAEFVYDDDNKDPDEIDFIIERLGEIINRNKIESEYDEGLIKKINKLYDHLKLEKVRLNTIEQENENMRKSIEKTREVAEENLKGQLDFNKQIEDTNKSMDVIKEKIKKSEDKLKKFDTQSITVLSIFTGVVMAFFGGMSFFSEVLKSMNDVSKYRLFFITLLIGFVLFNTIALLVILVSKIIDVEIRSKSICKEKSCICDKKCNSISRIKNKYPFMFYINVIMLSMMIVIAYIWYKWRFEI